VKYNLKNLLVLVEIMIISISFKTSSKNYIHQHPIFPHNDMPHDSVIICCSCQCRSVCNSVEYIEPHHICEIPHTSQPSLLLCGQGQSFLTSLVVHYSQDFVTLVLNLYMYLYMRFVN